MPRKRGYFAVGLDMPKGTENVGSALRACGVYGAAMLAVSGRRYSKHPTDTMAHYKRIPLLRFDDIMDAVPYDCVPVAVDLVDSAVPLDEYEHPERAFYVFGAEDATLGRRVLDKCRDKVYVRTAGCMNLAACVNVVAFHRCLQRGEWPDAT